MCYSPLLYNLYKQKDYIVGVNINTCKVSRFFERRVKYETVEKSRNILFVNREH
jgi:hypothetical protein